MPKYPFAVDLKILRQLDAEHTVPTGEATPRCHDYSAEQELAVLADFVRQMGPILERRAAELVHPLCWTALLRTGSQTLSGLVVFRLRYAACSR